MKDLQRHIRDFSNNPLPVFEKDLTAQLVKRKWMDLIGEGIFQSKHEYTTAGAYFKKLIALENGPTVVTERMDFGLEPASRELAQFYIEHGLIVLEQEELNKEKALDKLVSVFNLFDLIDECSSCIRELVEKVQILHQDDPEIDISYSHPAIPFSVFVTLCPENSLRSALRVAEGILHETMHLKLSLIEEVVPIVNVNSDHTYFSPWRNEPRPLRGVLHGMFVFRAIQQFYASLLPKIKSAEEADFITWRLEEIQEEFSVLTEFPKSTGLTKDGAILAVNLLPLS